MTGDPPEKPDIRVLAISINYNRDLDTTALVHDLLQQDAVETLHIVVVDNSDGAPGDRRLEGLAQVGRRTVEIQIPDHNLGYFGGAAWGLERYLQQHPMPDWVMVSNTDLGFTDRSFFSRLLTLYSSQAPAVLAPRIISARSGADQNPHFRRRPPARQMHLYKWIFRFYLINITYQSLSIIKRNLVSLVHRVAGMRSQAEKAEDIYAPHGSLMLFHRQYFESGGTLHPPVFLFGEELFVAETARRLRLRIVYDPRFAVVHKEHATTSPFRRPSIARYMAEAAAYLADHYFPLERSERG